MERLIERGLFASRWMIAQIFAALERLDASGEWSLHNVLYRICACMYCKATD